MKAYVGIDLLKDKFYYSAMDDTLNILYKASEKENSKERFIELSVLIKLMIS
jgi:hypothetical protein